MGRKTTVWIFQAANCWDFTREDMDMAYKGKQNILAQNNAIGNIYVKAEVDNTQ